jgi:DNA-binding response OmpR family regulator
LKDCKVLILEDDPEIGGSLKRVLEEEGFEVQIYKNAEEAMKGFNESPAEVALVDIRLHGIDGAEFIRDLKRKYPLVHVVVITAYPSVENAFTCLTNGADEFIPKPFEMKEILRLVKLGCERINRWKKVLKI